MTKNNYGEEFAIHVDGENYIWRLHRRPQWSSDTNTYQGMALAARHAEGKREVVLEFPAGRQPRFGAPLLQAARIQTDLVKNAITAAIAAGWEPLSRGKTVTIIVDAEGN
jgi:hypothetical protein